MNLFFINPPFKKSFSRSERSPQVSLSGTLYFPLLLSSAAGAAESAGAEIFLHDAVAEKSDFDKCIDLIAVFDTEWLIVETSTPSWENDSEFISKVKERLPSIKTVALGPHVSALPQEALESCPKLDYVIRGEYEKPIISLVKSISENGDLKRVPGLCMRDVNGYIINEGEVIENLDTLPHVSGIYKRFLNHHNYYFAAADYPGIMIMTGRGCPHRCTWCLYSQVLHGKKYRLRSPENIIEELRYIRDNFHDVKEIWIEDDTFTASREQVRKVCHLILREKLAFKNSPLKWYCNARPPIDFDTLSLMKQAGCRLLVVGFESGNQSILNNINKGFTTKQAFELMRDTRKLGILVHGCFVIGNPGETKESMDETLVYAKRLRPDSAQFYFVHPYPGTRYYQWAKENGYIEDVPFSAWLKENGMHRCVLNLPGISSREIEVFCSRSYRKFHLSPPYLLAKLKQAVLTPREGLRSFRSAYHYFFNSLKE